MAVRFKSTTDIGDLITGSVLPGELDPRSDNPLFKTTLITNVNPTGSSYQNLISQAEGLENTRRLKIPIPSDIWYLWPVADALNFLTDVEEFKVELKGQVEDVGILRQPRSMDDITGSGSPQVIFLMRYQSINMDASFDWDIDHLPDKCYGFLDFIVGPPGVMKTLSLCGEETGEVGEVLKGEKIIPPKSETPEVGINLITDAYKTKGGVPLIAKWLEGELKPKVHFNFRVFLMEDDKFPTPGEFLGLLARPVIGFAWFNQETSPFICGGNFFHTAAYSSGVVTAVEGDNKYTVSIEGEETSGIESSDYLEYAEGDRVALMHTLPSDVKFKWKDTLPLTNLRILPITFYQA